MMMIVHNNPNVSFKFPSYMSSLPMPISLMPSDLIQFKTELIFSIF
uniref:Uncharacterized protein n=1 Tax=Arcella intermedia TaxID=1963864 RepID=A0A6B2LUS8_9EUKA